MLTVIVTTANSLSGARRGAGDELRYPTLTPDFVQVIVRTLPRHQSLPELGEVTVMV